MTKRTIIGAIVYLLLLTTATTYAKTTTWKAFSGGSWTSSGSWTNGVPANGDQVVIPSDVSGTITDVPSITLAQLIVQGTCTLERVFSFSSRTLTISNGLDVAQGKDLILSAISGLFSFNIILSSTANSSILGTVSLNTQSTLTNQGVLVIGRNGLIRGGGNSTFVQAAGGTLKIGSADGINASGSTGNVQTATRTYSAAAGYEYVGAGAQWTGTGLPDNLTGSLVINNPGYTVTLSSARTINGSVVFSDGMLNTGTNTLTLGSSATVTGEKNGSYILGTCVTSRAVGTSGSTFGGLGVTLGSSTENLGNVTLTRYSGPMGINSFSTSQSIARTWRFAITGTQPANGVSMTLSWVTDDNNVLFLPNLIRAWRSTDNRVSWTPASSNEYVETPSLDVLVTEFSDWTISDGNSPLPVELVSFGATRLNDAVVLRWKTATETNNYGFDVERSLDGSIWSTIGFVAGSGTTSSEKSYTYRDTPDWQAASGGVRYRLRQIDRDGTTDYSSVVLVAARQTVAQPLRVHPQPLATGGTATVLVTLPHAGDITLEMHDSMGRLVATFTQGMREAGTHTIATTLPQVARGVYALRATLDGTPLAVLPLLITR